MISIYEEYLPMTMSLSIEEMAALHREMANEVGDDKEALEFYEEIMDAAARYMEFRSHWNLWSREERREKDSNRTSSHDSLIAKLNMLARYLRKQGKAALWRDALGDVKEDPNIRKRIGDFGCYLAFVSGLHAR